MAAFIPTLAAAGQTYGNRRFFIETQFQVSALAPPSATRFASVQVNLLEPPLGLTSASTNIFDVSSAAPAGILVRYQLAGADNPLSGQFCSALTGAYPPNGVSNTNPCASGSQLGLAGAAQGFVGPPQTSEYLQIPPTVALQATQRIRQGSATGLYYFIRQFSSGKFAVVQLRPNNMAANAPLAFNEIRLGFRDGSSLQQLGFFKRGQIMPQISALLRYQGAGMLRARWEVVIPGDMPPSALDLQSEANLNAMERAQQRRYRMLDRVNIYLPPNGQATLQGPSPRLLPNEQYGQYLVLLRIEANPSLLGESAGASSFALPVLRYYVGESSGPSAMSGMQAQRSEPQNLQLLSPPDSSTLASLAETSFEWRQGSFVGLYRMEVEANGKLVYAARVRPSTEPTAKHQLPPFIATQLENKAVRWRVVALSSDGQFLGDSTWRELEIQSKQ
ncbi:MAG: hypothetical protein HC765_08485 [Brachymonas sp.]|nr:hypothetical protein [Brachymonas sp.]